MERRTAYGYAAMPRRGPGRYRPIGDYALLGDCHGSALVGRDGSVDWCCLRRHDDEPVFFRLLDADKGGHWSIRPAAEARCARAYLDDTNVLRTEFSTADGRVAVTDFMPVGRRDGNGAHDYVNLRAPHWLVRRIDGLEGSVEFEIDYRPRRGLAAEPVQLSVSGQMVTGEGVPPLFSTAPLEAQGDRACSRLSVDAGSRYDLVLAGSCVAGQSPLQRIDEFMAVTEAFWREWIAYCRYRGPYRDMVRRSALALKLMTYAPTGALIAAPTTSLPEEIGGERNWDYRYSWIRDSCFTLYALAALGYSGEARCYVSFLGDCVRHSLPEVRIMYGVTPETPLDELEFDHLDGYAGSRPVRTGNGAAGQRQIDVYGQVLDLALLYRELGGRLGGQDLRLLATLAAFVRHYWHEPDHGLWEMRDAPRHHVHGKLTSWVAADRAARLLDGTAEWRSLAGRIEDDIYEAGVDRDDGHLVQAYGGRQADAATLLAPMLGFPLRGSLLADTIRAVERELKQGDLVYRYRAADGLEGGEGAFMICSFWLVDAYLADGRGDEARQLYERLLAYANDLGLLPEEIDTGTGEFLGNYPQALTHLAVIGSAVNLQLLHRKGRDAIAGSYAGRARRAVRATFGWRAIWASMLACRRVGRLRSSPKSIMLWP